jgi:hypothetical protein
MIPCTLNRKPSVVWEAVPEIGMVQGVIARAYVDAGAVATITSCHDGNHSANSGHHQNDKNALSNAIDLRIMNLFRKVPIHDGVQWWGKVKLFAEGLAGLLNDWTMKNNGGSFFVVLEKDHIHLEYADNGKKPNIIGYEKSKTVYITKDVLGYLALSSPKGA